MCVCVCVCVCVSQLVQDLLQKAYAGISHRLIYLVYIFWRLIEQYIVLNIQKDIIIITLIEEAISFSFICVFQLIMLISLKR